MVPILQVLPGLTDAVRPLLRHSLGGAQAAVASAVTGLPAVIINPAGVHDNTFLRNGLIPEKFRADADAGLIRNIIHQGEMVDWLNGRSPAEISAEIKDIASDQVERVVTSAAYTQAASATSLMFISGFGGHTLTKQIEHDKAIPTPQQAIRFTSNALNAAREQGR